MQGTVKEFSEETRSGTVLLDDGSELPITPEAFATAGVRFFRFGQRVRFTVEGDGDTRRMTTIHVVTI